MPPRRPLPDLCIISVLKMLTPSDQLTAASLSAHFLVLVRAANRQMKMLVITHLQPFNIELIRTKINNHSLSSKPCLKMLATLAEGEEDEEGLNFPDYPMPIEDITKWNCLLVGKERSFDKAIASKITDAFSAITDLKVENYQRLPGEILVALLESDQWKSQLLSLTLFSFQSPKYTDRSTEHRVVSAINSISSLRYLALDFNLSNEHVELTVVSQLRAIVLDCGFSVDRDFLRSVERHAETNDALQVYVIDSLTGIVLCGFSTQFQRKTIRCENACLTLPTVNVKMFCRQMTALTSISISCYTAHQFRSCLSALAELKQLVLLKIGLLFNGAGTQVYGRLEKSERPVTIETLTFLRALELTLFFNQHAQLPELNFSNAMPSLQVIHLVDFNCGRCGVDLCVYSQDNQIFDYSSIRAISLGCISTSLRLLHHGVPNERILIGKKHPYSTLSDEFLKL